MIGIYLMGFVIAVSGIGVLGTAIAYAAKPAERTLELLRPLSLAAIFAALCSLSVGVAAALKGAAMGGPGGESTAVLLAGLSEACIPPFVAFAFLAVAWLLVVLGMRRRA